MLIVRFSALPCCANTYKALFNSNLVDDVPDDAPNYTPFVAHESVLSLWPDQESTTSSRFSHYYEHQATGSYIVIETRLSPHQRTTLFRDKCFKNHTQLNSSAYVIVQCAKLFIVSLVSNIISCSKAHGSYPSLYPPSVYTDQSQL